MRVTISGGCRGDLRRAIVTVTSQLHGSSGPACSRYVDQEPDTAKPRRGSSLERQPRISIPVLVIPIMTPPELDSGSEDSHPLGRPQASFKHHVGRTLGTVRLRPAPNGEASWDGWVKRPVTFSYSSVITSIFPPLSYERILESSLVTYC